jgi:hypothetical protein
MECSTRVVSPSRRRWKSRWYFPRSCRSPAIRAARSHRQDPAKSAASSATSDKCCARGCQSPLLVSSDECAKYIVKQSITKVVDHAGSTYPLCMYSFEFPQLIGFSLLKSGRGVRRTSLGARQGPRNRSRSGGKGTGEAGARLRPRHEYSGRAGVALLAAFPAEARCVQTSSWVDAHNEDARRQHQTVRTSQKKGQRQGRDSDSMGGGGAADRQPLAGQRAAQRASR